MFKKATEKITTKILKYIEKYPDLILKKEPWDNIPINNKKTPKKS